MVDVKRLDNALQNMLLDRPQKLYFWSEKMDDSANQLAIDFLGHTIDVPFSILDVEQLVSIKKPVPINSSSACIVPKEEFGLKLKTSMSLKELLNGLASLVLAKTFGVSLENLTTSVEIRPDCLVICRQGESFHSSFNMDKEPGTFGCMFMQLPVDQADCGFHLRIRNKKEMFSFEFKEDSSSSLYLGAIAGARSPSGKQDYTLSTPGRGPAVMIVCNLVWMDSFSLSTAMTPDRFPEFIHSVHEMNQALSLWKLPEEEDSRFMVLSLHSNYTKTEFNLSSLKDIDKQLAHALASIDYIDIELAILEEDKIDSELEDTSFDGIEKMYHWKEKTIADSKIRMHRWCSNGRSFLTNCTTIDSSVVIGPLSGHVSHINCCQGEEKHSDFTYRPVLVIQPKNRRFERITRFPNDLSIAKYFESRMGHVMEQMAHGNEAPRNLFTSDLAQVNPYFDLALSDASKRCWEANLNLFRLLNVSGRIKAAGEGLAFLDIITKQPLICENEEHVYSEEYLPQFTDTLADFICLVSGWEKTAELIHRLAKSEDVTRSYTISCDLGIKLYDRNCLEGAVQIADSILAVIHDLTDDQFNSLQDGVSWDLVDLVMYVDTDERTRIDPNRYSKLLAVLKRLPCDRLPYLMPHVEYSPRLVLDLGKIIVNSSFTQLEPWHFVSVIKVCEDLRAEDLLKEFWTKTCSQPAEFIEDDGNLRAVSLFEVLVLTDSLKIKQKAFLIGSMSCCEEARRRISESVEQFLRRDEWREDVSSISSYFLFIALADNSEVLSDARRVERFCSVYESLEIENLCSLVASLRQMNCTDIKQQPASNFMFKSLLQELLKRDFKVLIKSSSDSLIENFRFFAWFGDVELIGQFMKRLIDIEDDLIDKWKTIIAFVRRVIVDPDVVSINSSIIGVLLETWIVSVDNLKDSVSSDFVGSTSQTCFEHFIKAERAGLDLQVKGKLEELLKTLSPSAQIQVTNSTFIREIHSPERSMKTMEASWRIFSELCQSLTSKPLLKSVFFTLTSNQIVLLMQGLLWLGEELPMREVTELICKIPVVGSPLSLVSKEIVTANKTIHLASLTGCGVLAVNDLIDHCIERLHFKMQPKYSWAMAAAEYRAIPEIEGFLRSEAKKLRYGAFDTAQEAEKMLEKIAFDPAWGVTAKVKTVKNVFKIELWKSFPYAVAGEYERALKSNIDEMKAVRRKLFTQAMKRNSQASIVSMECC